NKLRLPLQAYSRPRCFEGGHELGIGLLHGVQEHSVGTEAADDCCKFVGIWPGATSAGVTRVIVNKDRHSSIVQGLCCLRQAGHVIEVPLVSVVNTDDRVGVPEHDPIKAAKSLSRVGKEFFRSEALGVEVEEEFIPEPHLRHGKTAC